MYGRRLNISTSQSFFLFGPRGTGKSTLVKETLRDVLLIDLLDPSTHEILAANPASLRPRIEQAKNEWIIIDEVQKVPSLLDLAHLLIENHGKKFALTGSSARKLRRGASNLLGGRAFVYNLHPLTRAELGTDFNLQRVLQYGSLPRAFQFGNESDIRQFLKSYSLTYLQEEIIAEQIVRNLPPFRRFLQAASQLNTLIVNFSNVASDIQSNASSVQNYFQILEDTLVGFLLEPFHRSIRKRQRTAPKFYFFDTGVVRALSLSVDDPLREQSYEYGRLFETFLVNEIRRALDYKGRSYQLSYLRTKDDAEIELIVEQGREPLRLIEIKSSTLIREEDLRSLKNIGAEFKGAKLLCLSRDPVPKRFGAIEALPWETGLEMFEDPSPLVTKA